MRRKLANLLLFTFLAGFLLPLFAETQSTLPACCRRDGKHHCSMAADARAVAPDGTTVASKAQTCPFRTFAKLQNVSFGIAATGNAVAGLEPSPTVQAASDAHGGRMEQRSHQERGPPPTPQS
jgi:hypothetical protein